MLDDLRAVRWPFALALFAAGAIGMALLLTLVFGLDSKAKIRVAVIPGTITAYGHADATASLPAATTAAATTGAKAARANAGVPAGAPSLAALVGQRLMVGLHTAAPTSALLADVRKGQIGGIVIFTEESSPAEVKQATAQLQAAAAAGHQPALLIATDQEGAIKRLPGPPKPLSRLNPGAAHTEGEPVAGRPHQEWLRCRATVGSGRGCLRNWPAATP